MINRIINRIIKDIFESVLLVIKRLPTIAFYTFAFFIVFSVGDRMYYRLQSADHFVHYTSFTVQNSREGEDVPFTLCRDHRGNFLVNGLRTIYIIPEGKSVDDKVFAANKPLNGVIDGGNCSTYFIRESEYHHKPGTYVLTINLKFKTKYGYEKELFVISQAYKIYPASNTQSVDSVINNLNVRIQENTNELNMLKRRLGLPVNPSQDPTRQPESFDNTTTPRETPSNQPTQTTQQPSSQSQQPQQPAEQSGTPFFNPLSPVTNVINGVNNAIRGIL